MTKTIKSMIVASLIVATTALSGCTLPFFETTTTCKTTETQTVYDREGNTMKTITVEKTC